MAFISKQESFDFEVQFFSLSLASLNMLDMSFLLDKEMASSCFSEKQAAGFIIISSIQNGLPDIASMR